MILEVLQKAKSQKADLVLFPELAITGYPPLDLLDRRSFITHNLEALERVAEATRDLPAALVGFVDRDDAVAGKGLYNAAAFCNAGKVQSIHQKKLLPTYDVFDEARYFDSGVVNPVLVFQGRRFGVTICEDIWNNALYWRLQDRRRLYEVDPVEELHREGAEFIINLSASPYTMGKRELKKEMFASMALRWQSPLLHVNLVGGNDNLIFDGWSNVFNDHGEIVAQCRDFEESLLVVEADAMLPEADVVRPQEECFEPVSAGGIATVHEALLLGLRDYVRKCGFKSVIVGLSGGIDSAVTCALAARALGREKVTGVAMPSEYSSEHSRTDARRLAENLGIAFHEIAVREIYDCYLKTMQPVFEGTEFGVAEENFQARIRGNILMGMANKFGHLVLSTGNKSELAVGYCTLYGDMSGGLAVLSDVPKTLVYDLARYINQDGEWIPHNTIVKPPSAELRPDQFDSDSLPPYEVLDPIIRAYVEEGLYSDEIADRGFERDTVERVLRMIARNEYKRRQAAIGLKVTHRAFGYGRRMPVARGNDFE